MERRYTVAELEEAVSNIDRQLQDVPHGHLFRDHMSRLLTRTKQAGPNAWLIDLDDYLKYWRNLLLSNDLPETVPLAPDRLDKKGRHLVVLPAFGGPIFRDAGLHFEPEDIIEPEDIVEPECIIEEPDLAVIRVCRPSKGYGRRKVLGARVRYKEYGRCVICYGLPSWVLRFIQDQRKGASLDRKEHLVSYLTEKLGWPAEHVTHYIRDVDFNQS